MVHRARGTNGRRTTSVLALAGIATLLGALSLAAAAPGAGRTAGPQVSSGPENVPAEIAGTVKFYGCTPDLSKLRIVAEPLSFEAPGLGRFAPDPRSARHVARYGATEGRPGLLEFSIVGLRPGALYRLGADYPSEDCGKVFWRGPFEGLAVADGPNVELEGFAARTAVEVQQLGTDRWLGADGLLFTDPDAQKRRFRWHSTVPGVTGGELQVSLDAFPTTGDFGTCDETETGVVYRQDVPADGGEWVDLGTLDLVAILSPGRAGGADQVGGSINARTFRGLVAGAPVYVRVVPMTAAGPACDVESHGVVGAVLLGNVEKQGFVADPVLPPSNLSPGDGHVYLPPYTGGDAQGHPTYSERAFKVIKDHKLPPTTCTATPGSDLFDVDPLGCLIVNAGWRQPGSVLEKGPWFLVTPSSSSGGGGGSNPLIFVTSSLGTLVTGVYSAAGLLVDAASELYEDVKAAVKEVALDVVMTLPGLGGVCDSNPNLCAAVVDAALTTGMAAIGLPPSIPNWDQLKNEGIEYLAAEIQSQTGIPQELSEKALETAVQAMEEISANRGIEGSMYDWLLPYAGFEPASLTVVVRKTGTDPLPFGLVLARPNTPLFEGGFLGLPTVFPADGELRIPIVLQPNLDAIPAPLCRSSLYTTPQIQCSALPPGVAGPFCEWQPNLGQDVNTNPYKPYDCSITNYPALYYRDRWVNERLDTVSGCTFVTAVTRLAKIVATSPFTAKLVLEPAPLDWRFQVVGLVRPRLRADWNGPEYSAC